MIGKKFGLLTVIKKAPSLKGHVMYKTSCDCGGAKTARGSALRYGHVKSCGCMAPGPGPTHGHTVDGKRSSTFVAWDNMIGRCYRRVDDPSTKYWRDIFVCKRWLTFENFLADMGEKPEGLTLDRINSAKDYSPDNCRWATRTQQSRNTKMHRDNKSGVRGVCYVRDKDKWRASIAVARKSIHLGYFDTLETATEAREAGEIKHWGDAK